jgi:hypothetical protein
MQFTINVYTIFFCPPVVPLRNESLPVAEDAFAAQLQTKVFVGTVEFTLIYSQPPK